MLQITPQLSGINVPQKPLATKQQYIDGVVEQIEVPPLPPSAHMQPLAKVVHQQSIVGSEHPLKHIEPALPQLKPKHPLTVDPAVTLIVLLEYAPAFPGIPAPQQHILADEPPAPQISIEAVPLAGATQQTQQ
jgi:hypothetical protein